MVTVEISGRLVMERNLDFFLFSMRLKKHHMSTFYWSFYFSKCKSIHKLMSLRIIYLEGTKKPYVVSQV